MEAPNSSFLNNDIAAHRVSEHISPHRFSIRPYNRFLPDFTEWWFFSARGADSWPAYRLSKLFIQTFRPSSKAGLQMYIGFYVEKGLDSDLSTMPEVKRKFIMQSDWYWHEFLDLASTGKYDRSLKEMCRRSGCPIWLSIDIQEFNRPPELDTERPPFYDILQFTVRTENLKLQLERPGMKTLKKLNSTETLQELAQRLRTIKDLRFFWVNMQIGLILGYGEDALGAWGAEELWQKALDPWESWV